MGKKKVRAEVSTETQIRKLFTVALEAAAEEQDIELKRADRKEIVDELVIAFSPAINGIVDGALAIVLSDGLDEDEEDEEDEDEDEDEGDEDED